MKSIGCFVRKILGQNIFPIIGKWYRSIFIDLKKVCMTLPPFKENAILLDVGGGDGELLNYVLLSYPNIKIDMIDIAANIGGFIKPEFKSQVRLFPNTSIKEYSSLGEAIPDYLLVSCVLHHVENQGKIFL